MNKVEPSEDALRGVGPAPIGRKKTEEEAGKVLTSKPAVESKQPKIETTSSAASSQVTKVKGGAQLEREMTVSAMKKEKEKVEELFKKKEKELEKKPSPATGMDAIRKKIFGGS